MIFFSVSINPYFEDEFGPTSRAEGALIQNGEDYFPKMRRFFSERTIFLDAPVFDYFYLTNGAAAAFWEWKLQDVHAFTGKSPDGWLISDKLKILIDQFKIIPQYHFYPSKLLFRGEKLDYWVFQWGVKEFSNFDYEHSIFYEEGTNNVAQGIVDFESFMAYRQSLEKDLACKRLVLKAPYDFIVGHRLNLGLYMSEKLKIAIEEAGIDGLLFEEIDFEIVLRLFIKVCLLTLHNETK